MPEGAALFLEPTNPCFQEASFSGLEHNLFSLSLTPTYPHPVSSLLEGPEEEELFLVSFYQTFPGVIL